MSLTVTFTSTEDLTLSFNFLDFEVETTYTGFTGKVWRPTTLPQVSCLRSDEPINPPPPPPPPPPPTPTPTPSEPSQEQSQGAIQFTQSNEIFTFKFSSKVPKLKLKNFVVTISGWKYQEDFICLFLLKNDETAVLEISTDYSKFEKSASISLEYLSEEGLNYISQEEATIKRSPIFGIFDTHKNTVRTTTTTVNDFGYLLAGLIPELASMMHILNFVRTLSLYPIRMPVMFKRFLSILVDLDHNKIIENFLDQTHEDKWFTPVNSGFGFRSSYVNRRLLTSVCRFLLTVACFIIGRNDKQINDKKMVRPRRQTLKKILAEKIYSIWLASINAQLPMDFLYMMASLTSKFVFLDMILIIFDLTVISVNQQLLIKFLLKKFKEKSKISEIKNWNEKLIAKIAFYTTEIEISSIPFVLINNLMSLLLILSIFIFKNSPAAFLFTIMIPFPALKLLLISRNHQFQKGAFFVEEILIEFLKISLLFGFGMAMMNETLLSSTRLSKYLIVIVILIFGYKLFNSIVLAILQYVKICREEGKLKKEQNKKIIKEKVEIINPQDKTGNKHKGSTLKSLKKKSRGKKKFSAPIHRFRSRFVSMRNFKALALAHKKKQKSKKFGTNILGSKEN